MSSSASSSRFEPSSSKPIKVYVILHNGTQVLLGQGGYRKNEKRKGSHLFGGTVDAADLQESPAKEEKRNSREWTALERDQFEKARDRVLRRAAIREIREEAKIELTIHDHAEVSQHAEDKNVYFVHVKVDPKTFNVVANDQRLQGEIPMDERLDSRFTKLDAYNISRIKKANRALSQKKIKQTGLRTG